MTQTLSGLTPASAVVGAALTSGFSSNEATLRDYTNGNDHARGARRGRGVRRPRLAAGERRRADDLRQHARVADRSRDLAHDIVGRLGVEPGAQQYHSVGTTMY
jgi:hypothetical protein